MPVQDDGERWREITEQAKRVVEAASHDPYDSGLLESMRDLRRDAHTERAFTDPATPDAAARGLQAAMHAAIGEAWLALLDGKRALAEFDRVLELLGEDGAGSGRFGSLVAHALCGRGKCLMARQRSAEAISALDASIDWYTTRGDLADEEQLSLLSQALHTLAMARDEVGDHAQAVELAAQAVGVRRQLAARNLERHRLALSRSLRNLGDGLIAQGRREEGRQAHQEMLELRQEQWQSKPSVAATLALAQATDIHAHGLVHGAGDLGEALALATRSARLYLDLEQAHPDRFAPALQQHAAFLGHLTRGLVDAGMPEGALAAAAAALELLRRHWNASGSSAPRLAHAMGRLSVALRKLGDCEHARVVSEEALARFRQLAAANRELSVPELAGVLNNLGTVLGRAGRHAEGIQAHDEALALFRELAELDRAAFLPDLVTSLNNRKLALSAAGRRAEAIEAAEELMPLYRELGGGGDGSLRRDLAINLEALGAWLGEDGRRAEGLRAVEEALALYRELVASDREASLPDLARCLHNLSVELRDSGRRAEAVRFSEEALASFRELAARNREVFLPDLARSLNDLGTLLSGIGLQADALPVFEQALEIRRELVARDRETFLPGFATGLHNLGSILGDMGRHVDAMRAAEEALALHRELATRQRDEFLPEVARSLNSFGLILSKAGRQADAQLMIDEAVHLYRELGDRYGSLLEQAIRNSSVVLGAKGQHTEALRVMAEASALRARRGPSDAEEDATHLNNMGYWLRMVGRLEEALPLATEAVSMRRSLYAEHPEAGGLVLAMSLNNLGATLRRLGRHPEARSHFVEAGDILLAIAPTDPNDWCRQTKGPNLYLEHATDLRRWFLPLLRRLAEHRELAWNSEHAQVFLNLQTHVSARVFDLLPSLPLHDADLLDEAIAALVTALQSPDLARWLEARGSSDGPLSRLAELKREVIEAEQLLAALRIGQNGHEDPGRRAVSSNAGIDEQGGSIASQIERHSAQARSLRQAFREERARLVAKDQRFAAAFKAIGVPELRRIGRYAKGSALLCLLELEESASSEAPSTQRVRTVGALIHADGRRTQLLELASVSELASDARGFAPEQHGAARRGPLRGAPTSSTCPPAVEPAASGAPSIERLTERMSRSFWAPLQQAQQEAGADIERLHICLHGATQQLPIALRQDSDCAGLHVTTWPGLPYLRRAAMAANDGAGRTAAPWLIGHDCAWTSDRPLPMVAVEAALLRHLLSAHDKAVQAIRQAAQLHSHAYALVACCHGGAEQVQFDHALHLGREPLTVRQILQQPKGPPLALLPACHAGRTDEDAAGNALGIAAAFMLSGTKVVVASSKAVPDLLQPWLSTLTVWHAMKGSALHEAAHVARAQFARLDFPPDYRCWLQRALPEALATIQPGGEEDSSIRGPRAHLALETVTRCWPWEGESQHLFSVDSHLRAEATRSTVAGILIPRGGDKGARDLAAEAREVAAFHFIYGVD